MKHFDEKLKARARTEACAAPEGFDGRLEHLLASLPEKNPRQYARPARTALVAAAICALVGTTALAYAMGAFDFLKGREEYQFLGQTERYEQYAQPVNLTQRAENGDELTIESMAMDGSFCTLFYTLRTQEKMIPWSGLKGGVSDQAPELWQAMVLHPGFVLEAEGVEISGTQTGQEFLADGHTLHGVARLLLERPLTEGEAYTLRARPSLSECVTVPALRDRPAWEKLPDKWSFPLTADPVETTTQRLGEGTLSVSPLGAVLTLKETGLDNFVLRDGETGAYIPYGLVGDTISPEEVSYELYGDQTDLRVLEVIPIQWGESRRVTAPLDALPARGDNAPGDFEVSSVELGEEKIVVRQRPVGAVTAVFGMVEFLDGEGQTLFRGDTSYVSHFTDWTTGERITTYTLTEASRSDADRVAGVRFTAHSYTLLEDRAVTIPLR